VCVEEENCGEKMGEN